MSVPCNYDKHYLLVKDLNTTMNLRKMSHEMLSVFAKKSVHRYYFDARTLNVVLLEQDTHNDMHNRGIGSTDVGHTRIPFN